MPNEKSINRLMGDLVGAASLNIDREHGSVQMEPQRRGTKIIRNDLLFSDFVRQVNSN